MVNAKRASGANYQLDAVVHLLATAVVSCSMLTIMLSNHVIAASIEILLNRAGYSNLKPNDALVFRRNGGISLKLNRSSSCKIVEYLTTRNDNLKIGLSYGADTIFYLRLMHVHCSHS